MSVLQAIQANQGKKMKKYLIKRLLSIIPILLIVSIVIFYIVHLTPGDPARVILGEEASDESVEKLRDAMGLNSPIIIQYFRWILNVFHGNLGVSVATNQPVMKVIAVHIVPTLNLAGIALIIALAIAVPFGVVAAKKKGTIIDNSVTAFAMLGISIPSFLMGLFLVLIFSVHLKILPVAGYKTVAEAGLSKHLRYLILPAVSLGLMEAALIARMTRASVLEVLNCDYIKMAKAKGVNEFALIIKHALRNALLPIITVVGQSFIQLLSGATVVETIFNIPGIGSLIVNSIGKRDYDVIVGIVLVITVVNVLVNLVVDLLYGVADPRIRLQD